MKPHANERALNRFTKLIEETIAPPLLNMSQIRYLISLQRTFVTMMPYLLLGATATLVLNLSSLFDGNGGLDLPRAAAAIAAVVEPCRPWLLQIVFVSVNLISLLASVLNGFFLGDFYHARNRNVSPIAACMVSLVAFACFIDFTALSENFDYPTYVMGSPSLFGALLISIFAVELYRMLVGKNITIKMPESVPPMIAAAFASLIPASIVVVLCAALGQGIIGFDFLAQLNRLSAQLVVGSSGPMAQFIGFFLDRVLWFVGLHGSNIVSSVMQPVWTTMITDNISAFAAGRPIPYMFTEQWINFYVRCSLFPVALLCFMSKSRRFKVLGKLSLPGTVFNIAEPVMYGLPVVLNPLMFVPWVCGFCLLFALNAALALLGVTPAMVSMVVWTMPAPLASFIGSGFNPLALAITLVNMAIIFLTFFPFFKVMERQELELERAQGSAGNDEPEHEVRP